ncbi:MAG TPA: ABC transporter substrate-binding protein [Dehalococcoidia bacterium]|nr:ABC transporter substrate-binding protein [Dehalococcoidia bacterium]
MKRWPIAVVLLAGLLALAACAAEEKGTPAPAGSTAATQDLWQQEWDQLVQAAKKEGKVAVVGPVGPDNRRAHIEPFEKKYGISVDYLGVQGPEFTPRLEAERGAGQYLWDVYIGGITHMVPLLPKGFFDPIGPALVLPEVKEPQNWQGGKGLYFFDKERLVVMMSLQTSGAWVYNPGMVDPKQFKSWKDLLDPKWKGKVLLHDPRVTGTGQSRLQFFYMHPELGIDYIRALAPQVVLGRDFRQQIEWVAQGRYPLLIAPNESLADQLIKEGMPVAKLDHRQLKEGGYLAGGTGFLILFSKPAHPNAAKLYVNWLLSREGQTEFTKGASIPSLRVDTPTDHIDPMRLPVVGYLNTGNEEAHVLRQKIADIANEIFRD